MLFCYCAAYMGPKMKSEDGFDLCFQVQTYILLINYHVVLVNLIYLYHEDIIFYARFRRKYLSQ